MPRISARLTLTEARTHLLRLNWSVFIHRLSLLFLFLVLFH